MILQELVNFYDVLASGDNPRVAPDGYSIEKIAYIVLIDTEGNIKSIAPHKKTITKGEKSFDIPQKLVMFESQKMSGISANYLYDNGTYIFGLDWDKKNKQFVINKKTKEKFDCFRQKNTDFLKECSSSYAKAFLGFLSKYNAEDFLNLDFLTELKQDLPIYNFMFAVDGYSYLLHKDPEIIALWEKKISNKDEEEEIIINQCALLGERLPIARINDKIRGVAGAQPAGAGFANYKYPSFQSYGKEQAYNSSISKVAMKKYIKAINWLLDDENKHKIVIGTTTVIFWAKTESDDYPQLMPFLFTGENDFEDQEDISKNLLNILNDLKMGKKPNLDKFLEYFKVNPNDRFFILGIFPNIGRLSVRFFYRTKFENFVLNVLRHYKDMDITSSTKKPFETVPTWRILKEIVSPKSDREINPLLEGEILKSILTGSKYPQSLLATLVRRVRIDSNTENNKFVKLNYIRAGMIKACLLRNDIQKLKEEITVSLNTQSTDNAYILGNLFAVLEKAQKEAMGEDINATIKDKYFSSACMTPASVFPTLLKLFQSHLKKIQSEKGKAASDFYRNTVSQIMQRINDCFAKNHSLDEQGRFIIGYYHQNAYFYTPKEKRNN